MTPLKPCPFCGHAPNTGCSDPGAPYPGGYFFIECSNDDCPARPCCDKKAYATEEEPTFSLLAARWNTRVKDDGTALRDALHICVENLEGLPDADADRSAFIQEVRKLLDPTADTP